MRILPRLQRILERRGFRKRHYWIERADDIPDGPLPYVVYAIGYSVPWQAALLCPCGCNHMIQLSLLECDSPHWSLSGQEKELATLYPSVWRTRGCGAHFILRQGEVGWCNAADN